MRRLTVDYTNKVGGLQLIGKGYERKLIVYDDAKIFDNSGMLLRIVCKLKFVRTVFDYGVLGFELVIISVHYLLSSFDV